MNKKTVTLDADVMNKLYLAVVGVYRYARRTGSGQGATAAESTITDLSKVLIADAGLTGSALQAAENWVEQAATPPTTVAKDEYTTPGGAPLVG